MVHRVTELDSAHAAVSEVEPSFWVLLHAEYRMILVVWGIFTYSLEMHGFPLNWLPLADACLLLCRGNPRTHIPLGPHIQHPIPLTFSAPTLTLNEHRQHSQPPKSLLGGPRLPLPSPLHLASPLVSRRDLTPVLRSPVSGTHGLDEGRCQPSVNLLWLSTHNKPQVRMTSPLLPLLQEALRGCGWS